MSRIWANVSEKQVEEVVKGGYEFEDTIIELRQKAVEELAERLGVSKATIESIWQYHLI